jgi:TPR repeat protein
MKRAVPALAVLLSVIGIISSFRTLAVEATVPHSLSFDDLRLFDSQQAHDHSAFLEPDAIADWISDRSFVHQQYARCTEEKYQAITRKDLSAVRGAWRECIEVLRQAVRRSPTDGRLWLELATETAGLEGVKTDATEALRMSYITALREGWIAKARQKFAKAAWANLPAEVRKLALEGDLDATQELAMGNASLSSSSSQGNEDALELLEASAEKGNAYAFEKLGEIYLKGDGVPVDAAKAQTYLEKAVEKGSTGAHLKLGRALWKGDQLSKDRVRGLQLIEKAALTNHWAQEVLGSMLLSGELPRDVPRAVALLESAANNGNPYALKTLGQIYLNGDGVPADAAKAQAYFARAAAKSP